MEIKQILYFYLEKTPPSQQNKPWKNQIKISNRDEYILWVRLHLSFYFSSSLSGIH